LCGILHNHGYHTHFHAHNTTSTIDAALPEARIPATLAHNGGGRMIAYNKSDPWASSLLPLYLPPPFPRQLACALEGALDTGNECLLVSCYLPQDHAEHAEAYSALTTLPLLYPDHLIILGGDF